MKSNETFMIKCSCVTDNDNAQECSDILLKVVKIEDALQDASNLLGRSSDELFSIKREIQKHSKTHRTGQLLIPKKPFKNYHDFIEFEDSLNADKQFHILVKEFTKISAPNYKHFIFNSWRALLGDKLAQKFRWQGTVKKIQVRNLVSTAALKSAFQRKYRRGYRDAFEDRTKIYFKNARNRYLKRKIYYKTK